MCLIWSCWEQRRRKAKTGERENKGRSDNQMHGCAGSLCCRYRVTDGGSRPLPPLTASQLQHWHSGGARTRGRSVISLKLKNLCNLPIRKKPVYEKCTLFFLKHNVWKCLRRGKVEYTFWGRHGEGDNDKEDRNGTSVKKRCGMGANEGSIKWGRNREKENDWRWELWESVNCSHDQLIKTLCPNFFFFLL